jgi:hypothetical protein
MSWITPELLDALRMVESSGNNDAVSPAGAVGEYQFMPQYVSDMGYGVKAFDPLDPVQARKAAGDYLAGMQRQYDWTPTQTLQAYNWGPGNMLKFISGDLTEMPPETSEYVGKFDQFGWRPEGSVPVPIEEPVPQVNSQQYTVQSGDNLTKIANDAGMTVQQLASLNSIQDINSIQVGQQLQTQQVSQQVPQQTQEAPPQADAGFLSPVNDFINSIFGGDQSGKPQREVTERIPKKHKDKFESFWATITGD